MLIAEGAKLNIMFKFDKNYLRGTFLSYTAKFNSIFWRKL